ncbi:hypothetical protein [Jatrophihabitans sp.]|uniref:hypothetical protein n=1 Tax=Jatrophihabitans sp. TaxID=1932789 RepID=UPI002D0C6EA8|nr:hypothetical protein [Jatrophihabitans sp.]
MPPRRRKPSGLSEEDVARLRSQLAEGRRPRVALSGPQFEAGASGSVVRIGDPATDGADFLTVRVKVNGVTDELAFAPAELSTGRARSAAAKPARSQVGSPTRTRPARTTPTQSTPTRPAVSRATTQPAPEAGTGTPAAGTPAAGPSESPARSTVPAAIQAPATQPTGASRRRKAPAAPTVSVTISSSGAAWSVSASRGARTVVKNAPVTPGAVTAIAELLGQPGVSEAVAEINEAARQQAQQRAEQLRAELHDLEAVLATHRAPR